MLDNSIIYITIALIFGFYGGVKLGILYGYNNRVNDQNIVVLIEEDGDIFRGYDLIGNSFLYQSKNLEDLVLNLRKMYPGQTLVLARKP